MTHHRVLTKKELKHFQFVFDKMEAWKKSVNDKSIRIGIYYNQDEILFKKYWNETVGKELDNIKKFILDNWLIEDKELGLINIGHYKRFNRV